MAPRSAAARDALRRLLENEQAVRDRVAAADDERRERLDAADREAERRIEAAVEAAERDARALHDAALARGEAERAAAADALAHELAATADRAAARHDDAVAHVVAWVLGDGGTDADPGDPASPTPEAGA